MINENIYNNIKQIILDCGKILVNADRNALNVQLKEGNNNFVTDYDVLIQKKLKNELLSLLPSAGFMGEENDMKNGIDNEYLFIVDPIDGTANFSRDFKLSAISVALLKDKKPLISFCYNPYINELYEAYKGHGAYLNGKKIHVSNKTLKNGIVFTGAAPYYDDLRKKTLELQTIFGSVASDFRRFGTAVIELCALACGKAELFYELKLMPWDYAAASLIIEEAGGIIKTIDGEDIQFFKPSSILASNGAEDYFKYIN